MRHLGKARVHTWQVLIDAKEYTTNGQTMQEIGQQAASNERKISGKLRQRSAAKSPCLLLPPP